MLNIFKILPIIILFIISSNYCFSQFEEDTMAVFRIENTYPLNVERNAISFDIYMQRRSEVWQKLANATLMLEFSNSDFVFDENRITTAFFDETDLPLPSFPGLPDIPEQGYLIEPKVFDNRISITILGPPDYDDAEFIVPGEDVHIGRFEISSTDGSRLPEFVVWKAPYNYYQACAYKIDEDSLFVDNSIVEFDQDDNLELDDGSMHIVNFQNDEESLGFQFDSLHVEYQGALEMEIHWSSIREIGVRGYTLIRGIQKDRNSAALEQIDTIAVWRQGSQFFNPIAVGKGNNVNGEFYGTVFDMVEFRGGEYCYELYGNIFNDETQEWEDVFLDRECEFVPHAVIAWGQANPNPFRDKTIIEFEVEDDVYMEVSVYDLTGKHVGYLRDNDTKTLYTGVRNESSVAEVGVHTTTFEPDEEAAAGLYNVLLIAYPINDPAVEISKALVKAVMIR